MTAQPNAGVPEWLAQESKDWDVGEWTPAEVARIYRQLGPRKLTDREYVKTVLHYLGTRAQRGGDHIDFRLLAAGHNLVPPRKWADDFDEFFSFWHATAHREAYVGSPYNLDPAETVLLWLALGGTKLNQSEAYALVVEGVRQLTRVGSPWACVRRLVALAAAVLAGKAKRRTLMDVLRLPEILWTVGGDRKRLLKLMGAMDKDQRWRVRWMISDQVKAELKQDRRAEHIRMDWEAIRKGLELPLKQFVATYAITSKAAWLTIHKRAPKAEALLKLHPSIIVNFDHKQFLRALAYILLFGRLGRPGAWHAGSFGRFLGSLDADDEDREKLLRLQKKAVSVAKRVLSDQGLSEKERNEVANGLALLELGIGCKNLHVLAFDGGLVQPPTWGAHPWHEVSIEAVADTLQAVLRENKANIVCYTWFEETVTWAVRLVSLFGKDWNEALDELLSKSGRNLHDVLTVLPGKVAPGLAQFILDNASKARLRPVGMDQELKAPRFHEFLAVIRAWVYLPEDLRREGNFDELARAALMLTYPGAQSAEFAFVAAQVGVAAEEYLDIEGRWLTAVHSLSFMSIPHVELEVAPYTIMTLAKDDPRGLFIGDSPFVACCQHPGGAGSSCAWHGVESPEGGFLVLFHGETVKAQSWIWRSEDVLVLDNIELASRLRELKPDMVPAYEAAARDFLGRLGIREVRLGVSGHGVESVPRAWRGVPQEAHVRPDNYWDYSDAERQYVIARLDEQENPRRGRFCPRESPITLDRLREIERMAYPPDLRGMDESTTWQDIADYCEVALRNMIVLSDGETWYAVVAQRGRHAEFVDLAKAPGSPTLDWIAIIGHLVERGIRTLTCDMRESTSYRKFMRDLGEFEQRGIHVVSDEPFEQGGEPFREMTITLPSRLT